jgi:hypothetical protein
MFNPLNYPCFVLVLSFGTFWTAALLGSRFRQKVPFQSEDNLDDFKFALGGTVTLLGLIIGFTFSMAVSRYDQRRNYEEDEANAIGTEYLRADLLPPAEAAQVRVLLKSYLNQRILHYTSRSSLRLRQIDTDTARLQNQMWSAVAEPAFAEVSPVTALTVAGMNDVLNSQGYTQFAWWNRIPIAAWILLVLISLFCNLLTGYCGHGRSRFVLLILPITLSICLFLIADIDSPRAGVIRVQPQNLESLAETLNPH